MALSVDSCEHDVSVTGTGERTCVACGLVLEDKLPFTGPSFFSDERGVSLLPRDARSETLRRTCAQLLRELLGAEPPSVDDVAGVAHMPELHGASLRLKAALWAHEHFRGEIPEERLVAYARVRRQQWRDAQRVLRDSRTQSRVWGVAQDPLRLRERTRRMSLDRRFQSASFETCRAAALSPEIEGTPWSRSTRQWYLVSARETELHIGLCAGAPGLEGRALHDAHVRARGLPPLQCGSCCLEIERLQRRDHVERYVSSCLHTTPAGELDDGTKV